MKLLLDEHYANAIAEQLRAAAHDVHTVSELGLKGIDDDTLLALADAEDRALLTNNARDFVALHSTWIAQGRQHAGLLLTSDTSLPRHRGAIGRYVEVLQALLDAHTQPRALQGQLRWLP